MAWVLVASNPFEPLRIEKHQVADGSQVIGWVQQQYPKTNEFPYPTICLLNGKPLLRADWTYQLKPNDVVSFVAVQGWEIVIAVVISVIISVAITLATPVQRPKGEPPTSDPVYSIKGQTNTIRLGEPIECCYGKNRIYPSFAAAPYYEYQNNDQYQYSIYCLGHGYFNVEEVRIGDTEISQFQDVTYEVVPPGGELTLFPSNVWTSLEVGGQELLPPMEVGPLNFGATNPAFGPTFVPTSSFVPAIGEVLHCNASSGLGLTVGNDYYVVAVGANSFEVSDTPGGTAISAETIVTFLRYGFYELGYTGPFATNPVGTTTTRIQVDLVWPRGIYIQTNTGYFANQWYLLIQYREINNSGDPIGDWTSFNAPPTPEWYNSDTFGPYWSGSAQTTTPVRKTVEVEVPEGRYEVRVRRIISQAINPDLAGDTVVWEAMRAWIVSGDLHDYGDVTLLAVKIRASNNLNERSQQKFNVIATRKLPIRNSSGVWSAPTTTRSIVWAFVDAFRANYGGRITDDRFFDWDTLLELDALYTSRNEYFDWVFRDPATVWEVAQTIARVGRGVPLLLGSLITLKRDAPSSLPVAMFNQENIVEGTFQWSLKLWDLDEFDSIKVEYTDPATGYKQENVTCVLPGGTGNHPQDLRVPGIQNRTHAYHLGLYEMAVQQLLRENISFETGLEGFIPTYGDLISVAHDVPKWGQSGYVVNAQRGTDNIYHLWVSEPLRFEESGTYQLALRDKRGEILGPFDAEQTEDDKQVIIRSSEDIDFLVSGLTEPMLFVFGLSGEVTTYLKVVRVDPVGGERIKITAVTYEPSVYSFDSLEPSALGQPATPPTAPDLPEVTQLIISPINGPILTVQASWTATFGAQYYVVQTSQDGVNWSDRGTYTRTSVQLAVNAGALHVRVAAVNTGQGPWITEQVSLGYLTGLFLSVDWENRLDWQVSWVQVLNAVGWVVKVYSLDESEPVLKRTETLALNPRTFLYDLTKAIADSNTVREMRVEVDVLFEAEGTPEPSGYPVSLDLLNSVPPAPTYLSHSFVEENSDGAEYHFLWTVNAADDLYRIKVWLSTVDGFDPEVVAPVYDSGPGSVPTSVNLTVPLDSDGEHPEMYWRVALLDAWGNELSSNITAQQILPAYA